MKPASTSYAQNALKKRLTQAQQLHAQGKLDAAKKAYRQLLRLHPKHPIALANLGAIYLVRQQFTQAITYLERALEVEPNYKDALNNLLLLHLQQKDFAQAATVGAHLVQLQPDHDQYTVRTYLAYTKQDQRQAMYDLLVGYIQACEANQKQPDSLLENHYIDSLFEFEDYTRLEAYLLAKDQQEKAADTPQLNTFLRLARLYREQERYQKAIAWLEQIPEDQRDGFGYHTEVLKTYGKSGDEETAIPSGQWLLDFKDQNGHELCDQNWVDQVTRDWPQRQVPEFNSDTPERNIIAFSLFGDNEKYTLAAVANAQLAKKIYPGWTARFYCGTSVPEEIQQALKDEGAQVEVMDESQGRFVGLFWRFYAANDPDVDYFICRDCDALLNDKEYLAVQEWLDSGKPFHLMRDHVQHAEIMLAGLWGGVSGWLPDIKQLVKDYYQPGMSRWADQNFQQIKIWPLIKPYTLTHDSFYDVGFDTRPYPEGHTLPKEWHVGGYVPLKVAKNFKASKKREAIKHIQDFNPVAAAASPQTIDLPSFLDAQEAMAWLSKQHQQLKTAQLIELAEDLRYRLPEADLLNLLGSLLFKYQQGETALALLEQAIELEPEVSKYVFNAALVAIKSQQLKAADYWLNYFQSHFDQPDDLERLQALYPQDQQTLTISL